MLDHCIASVHTYSVHTPHHNFRIIGNSGSNSNEEALLPASENPAATDVETRMVEIYNLIRTGAKAFLRAEYFICLGFIAVFGLIVFILVSYQGAGVRVLYCFKREDLPIVLYLNGHITSPANLSIPPAAV